MKRITTLFCLLVSIFSFAKKAKDDSAVGLKFLDDNFSRYDVLQKEIHKYAETAFNEYRSSKALAAELENEGFSIEWGAGGLPTAFTASYGSGKPVIGILAEYDALPGLSQDTTFFKKALVEGGNGHGCGHNLLGTASAAAAVSISKWLANGHEGTVVFFGCPAEEKGSGKVYMTRSGCFNGCDAVFSWHPDNNNHVPVSAMLANIAVKVSFHGKAAGASQGWEGRSALDALEVFNYSLNMMREHIVPSAKIQYIVTNGGQAANIVPDFAEGFYIFRHPKMEGAKVLFERAMKAAQGAAMATETDMSSEIYSAMFQRNINHKLASIFLKNLQKVGGPVLDEREKDLARKMMLESGVKADDLSYFEEVRGEFIMSGGGSTDVGDVSQVVPVASVHTCAFISGVSQHNWQATALDGTTIGTKAAICAAKVFYLSALELFTNEASLKEVNDEFVKWKGDSVYSTPIGDRKPPIGE